MGRVKVNLTLDANVAETARSLGLKMSRLAEAAIIEAAKVERNRLWREANQQAIDAYGEEIAKDGLPVAPFAASKAPTRWRSSIFFALRADSMSWIFKPT